MALRVFRPLGCVVLATWLSSIAVAEPAPDARRSEDFPNIGGAMNRFLPPRQMVPDTGAQPNGAAEGHPAGLTFRKSPLGLIYTDAAGRTVYQARVSGYRLRGDPALYCTGACAAMWTALPAPADAKPVGAWKVVEGANGRQWAYGRNPVFTYTGDRTPGQLNGHEFEDMFFAINYIPPVPRLETPANVAPVFVDHEAYVLADGDNRPLYGYGGDKDCKALCGKLTPFAAALGNKPVGDWTIVPGDRPQWAYKGKRVFAGPAGSSDIIDRAAVLRP
jgi:predicted lipoprotein with Yx(FWY)xxD motif